MSPRLIAILMLTVSAAAMATESTTETVVDEVKTNAEAVVEETKVAAEEVVDEATQAAETAVEETQAAAEEVADEASEAAETAVEETQAAAEEMADEASEATETAVEETQAAVEEVADEATEAAETATEETQAAVEEVVEETKAQTEDAATQTETAAEDTTEQAAEQDEVATEVTETEDGTKVEEVVEVAEPTEIEKEAGAEEVAGTVDVTAKVAACAACHGADGNSVIPQNPKLAGQVPGFIADQLSKFKSGERDNAIMGAQVANLTDEDMIAIDAFYSSQQPQLGAISEDMQEQASVGETIFRGGEPSMSISACMSCHGPSGNGIPVRFPRVSGQHVEYLEQALLAYKNGSRKSDVMNPIAFRLSEQQIKSLSIYMHALK